jgi:predicted metal-dependent peptidase
MDRFDIKGRISDRKVKCAVAIDTSGSMGEEELKYVFTEIFSILDSLRFELTIIECDCEIQRVYTAKCLNDVDTKVKGRGGTSFQPIFKYIHENKKLRQQLDFLIVFTDGYGEYEMSEEYKPRGFDLMWVLTESVKTLSVKNPWTNKLRELDFRNRNKR